MERCGVPYKKFCLVTDRPFTDSLVFDEGSLRKIPRTYVHCTKSEFLAVGKCAGEDVLKYAKRDYWNTMIWGVPTTA